MMTADYLTQLAEAGASLITAAQYQFNEGEWISAQIAETHTAPGVWSVNFLISEGQASDVVTGVRLLCSDGAAFTRATHIPRGTETALVYRVKFTAEEVEA